MKQYNYLIRKINNRASHNSEYDLYTHVLVLSPLQFCKLNRERVVAIIAYFSHHHHQPEFFVKLL